MEVLAATVATTAWPSSARRNGPPFRYGATAIPIGKKRAFSTTAATIAGTTPPPPPNTDTTANWAVPEKATTEKTIGATSPHPAT
jgi:hypothetical protein